MRTTPLLRTLTACVLAASASPAQAAPCLSENDLSNAVVGSIFGYFSSGPGVWGWEITAPSTLVVQSGRIYTTNNYTSQVGPHMKLEIWDEDPANPGQPGQRLAGGTWRIRIPTSWQGANFDAPVVMQANTKYWIVLHEPGWSTPPIEPGGSSLPMKRLNGGTWTSMNPEALKFRLYCGYLDGAGVATVGAGCPGSSGGAPATFTNYPANVGTPQFAIEASGFGSGALTIHAFGTVQGYPAIPLPGTPGCFLYTSLDVVNAGSAGTGDVRAQAAMGHVRTPLPIPSSSALSGFSFTSQLASLDPGLASPVPFVTTNALQITIN